METLTLTRTLAAEEVLSLLRGIDFGRIVFCRYALPMVRPVNHAIIDDTLVICGGSEDFSVNRQVVAYEADAIDPRTHLGWFVTVSGIAEVVTDRGRLDRYRALFRPWIPGPRDLIVAVRPEIVSGIRFLERSMAAAVPPERASGDALEDVVVQ